MIKYCSCKHEYQEKVYGPGLRVHNEAKSSNKSEKAYTCTVCGVKKG